MIRLCPGCNGELPSGFLDSHCCHCGAEWPGLDQALKTAVSARANWIRIESVAVCQLHGAAMMVEGCCLECHELPDGWGETNTPLDFFVLRRLAVPAGWGLLAFVVAFFVDPGVPRGGVLAIAGGLWVWVIDRARRQGWSPAVHRLWQEAELTVAVAMLLLVLFNRVLR